MWLAFVGGLALGGTLGVLVMAALAAGAHADLSSQVAEYQERLHRLMRDEVHA